MSVSGDDDLSAIEDDLEVVEEPETVVFVEENNQLEENNLQEENTEDQDAEDEADKKEIKTKRVRNPQPKLDAERLKGDRGLTMLKDVFEKVKFKGRGFEEEDLSLLMKNYEYWCHRLFPKLPFDDCLERIERLGNKKPVQTYIKKIRMDLLNEEDDAEPNIDEDDNVDNTESAENTERSDFDDLLPQISQPSVNTQADGLTDEQLERIRINRERAQRLRQQMLIRNREKAQMELMNKSLSNDLNLHSETEATELSQGSSGNEILNQINIPEPEPMSTNSETSSNKPEIMSTSSQSSIENMSISLEPVASQMSVSEPSQQQTSLPCERQLSNENMSVGSAQDSLLEKRAGNENFVRLMSLDLEDQREDDAFNTIESSLLQPNLNVDIVDNVHSSHNNSEVAKEDHNLDKELLMDVDNS